jgi:hypothetical protein
VTVAPNAKSGTARGELVATLPKPAAAPAPPSGSGSAACAIQRTLLENGNVQLTYADGTVATYYASGGYSTQSPDGIATQAMHVNVPHPVPPSLPDDPEISAWLDGTNGDLLDQIRALVQDDAAVDRYVSGEAAVAPTVYEQIRKRIGVLGQLQAAR